MKKLIYVECYFDELFINKLVDKRNNIEIIHIGSKSKVINNVINKHRNDEDIIGIIDEDPNAIHDKRLGNPTKSYDQYFNVYKVKHKKIIELKPHIEGFLLRICREVSINLSNIPSNEEDLQRITQSSKINQNRKINRLLDELINKNLTVLRELKNDILDD